MPRTATAGGSAAREAGRRRRRERRARVLGLTGVVVVAAAAFTGVDRIGAVDLPPGALTAAGFGSFALLAGRHVSGRWAAGAAGEQRTAATLDPLDRYGFVVFHDVRLPDRRWNIDHLVVGPPGLVVVETKQWSATNVVAGRRHLRVDGRKRDEAIEQVLWQVDAVARSLKWQGPVAGYLCIHGPRIRRRWFWRHPATFGIRVGDGRALARWLCRLPRVMGPGDVAQMGDRCRKVFVSGA